MGLWKLVKETYKGSKYLLTEVNKGINAVNNELEAYNAKQALIEPIREARYLCKKNLHRLEMIKIYTPEECTESKKLIASSEKLLCLVIQLMQHGIDDRNGCRDVCIIMAEAILEGDGTSIDIYSEFQQERFLNRLKNRGYVPPTDSTDDTLDRVDFAFSYDKDYMEQEARKLNIEIQSVHLDNFQNSLSKINERFNLKLKL